jgi:hypothetical protein
MTWILPLPIARRMLCQGIDRVPVKDKALGVTIVGEYAGDSIAEFVIFSTEKTCRITQILT